MYSDFLLLIYFLSEKYCVFKYKANKIKVTKIYECLRKFYKYATFINKMLQRYKTFSQFRTALYQKFWRHYNFTDFVLYCCIVLLYCCVVLT